MISKAPPLIDIRLDWCKGCGICIGICPRNVFTATSDRCPEIVDGARCTRCLLCELICPDFAIQVEREEQGNR